MRGIFLHWGCREGQDRRGPAPLGFNPLVEGESHHRAASIKCYSKIWAVLGNDAKGSSKERSLLWRSE